MGGAWVLTLLWCRGQTCTGPVELSSWPTEERCLQSMAEEVDRLLHYFAKDGPQFVVGCRPPR